MEIEELKLILDAFSTAGDKASWMYLAYLGTDILDTSIKCGTVAFVFIRLGQSFVRLIERE